MLSLLHEFDSSPEEDNVLRMIVPLHTVELNPQMVVSNFCTNVPSKKKEGQKDEDDISIPRMVLPYVVLFTRPLRL